MDSNYSSEEDFEYENDIFEDFLHYNSDQIYEIYDDLKFRFKFSPFFLSHMQYYHIVHLLSDIVVYKKSEYKCKNTILQTNFDIYYKNEIVISYNILAAFLKRNFKINLKYDEWLHFCITLSDLYELYKYKE
jgi:hypothetical protein